MIKQVVATTGFMLLCASYAHSGQSGDYVGISSGAMLTSTEKLTDRETSTGDLKYDKIGLPAGLFLGHQFETGFRVEGEVFYKKINTDEFHYSSVNSNIDSKVWSVGSMINLYYDWFHNVSALADGPYSPYVGLGIGFANVNMSAGTVNGFKLWQTGNDTAFAYQLAIGSAIPIYKNINLDVSYRYFGTTNISIGQITTNYNNHNYLLGIRYNFR